MCAINLYRLFVMFFLVVFISSCSDKAETGGDDPVVRPVKFIKIAEASQVESNRFPAIIDASKISELSMQVGGLLKELPIHEAQEIDRGAVIAKIDQRDFLDRFKAVEAEFENANDEYNRAAKLAKEDAISKSVLQQRKAQRDITQTQLSTAKKALDDSTLLAPFKGVVARVPVKELQTITAGTVVAILMAADILEATIDLPASYIAQIPKSETPETSERKAFVILDTAPNKKIEATFKEASLIADSTSQTYAVTFTFVPPNEFTILPGMNATVEVISNNHISGVRVAVPLDAMLSDGVNRYVWVVDPKTMKVSKQAVSVEDGVGDTIVVTDGLDANQIIVGAGASYLSEGMEVSEWKH